jgi:conjugal transfer pilus assembly protein TraW
VSSFLIRVVFCFFIFSSPLTAKDLGVHGKLFPIEEESLLEYIKRQAGALSNEERVEIEESCKKKIAERIKEPKCVQGLGIAKRYRCFFYDPSITANAEIKDSRGNVIVKKGMRVNPLRAHSLPEVLLFFDGTDDEHIRFAQEHNKSSFWVLVKGRPLDLEEEKQRAVYFDQLGVLVRKLGIQNIPARVSQEGNRLKIEEIPIEEES